MICARWICSSCVAWVVFASPIRATVVQIQFVNLAPLTFECGTPATLPCGSPTFDASDVSQPHLGVGHALAEVPAGILKAELTAAVPSATTGGSYSLSISVTDTFIITGPPSPTPVPGTAFVDATGIGLAPFLDSDTPEPGGQSFGVVRAFVGAGGFDSLSFSTSPMPNCCTVAADVPFPISLMAVESFSATVGAPRPLRYGLVLQGANGTNLDLMTTAQVYFSLPPGYSIHSTGGFAQDTAVVPEPANASLAVLTVFALLYSTARKERRAAMGRELPPPTARRER